MTPKFTILAKMGKKSSPRVAELPTDLLLLTKVEGMALGPGPQSVDDSLKGLISRKIDQRKFRGDLARSIRFDLNPALHKDSRQRHVLLVGIGSSHKFDREAACKVFGELIDQALRLGVEHVTIPFPANRTTGPTLNLKGTAHILKEVVEEKVARLSEPGKLKEIVIYCTPQAATHIEAGLRAPVRAKGSCCCKASE
jgi:hypothetical protein